MAIDGLVIHAITHELQSLVGGRIHKIYQPFERDLIIHVRTRGATHKLLISANPTYPRIYITDQSFENPPEPPMFCMVLRKYCENGTIESIEQIGMERIIHIQIRHRDELGDMKSKRLIVEIMGRHSNIMLVDPERKQIIDSIHRVTPAMNRYRYVMPGAEYVPPPKQNKQNPLEVSANEFHHWLQNEEEKQNENIQSDEWMARRLIEQFSGIGPLNAKEITHRGIESFPELMRQIREHRYEPTIIETKDGSAHFSIFTLTHLDGKTEHFASIHPCLDYYFGNKAERELVKQKIGNLFKWLQREIKKNENKLQKLTDTLNKAQNADHFRILGDLLTASLHTIKRGDHSAEVINYYEEPPSTVHIELDPRLSPSENAQQYYKKYTKSKNSITIVQEQIKQTKEEIVYLETILQQLNMADLDEVEDIYEELIEQKYIRPRNRGKKKNVKRKEQIKLEQFTSSEGIPILVGKNNKQNDYLTNRLARPDETWLHTKDIPGSHVLIRSNNYGPKTLEEAAMIAAYFSKARNSSQVPVDYTLIRHVRKPNGAKPGYVIYEQQKTVYVTPDESIVNELRTKTS